MLGFIFFYFATKFMKVPCDRYFQIAAFCCVALAGVFNFILDFFDPLASIRTRASELCKVNLEDGSQWRTRHYKILKTPSIVLIAMETTFELFSLAQGG
jgi:hypothetical protein